MVHLFSSFSCSYSSWLASLCFYLVIKKTEKADTETGFGTPQPEWQVTQCNGSTWSLEPEVSRVQGLGHGPLPFPQDAQRLLLVIN